jgi:hypothetical protein
VTIFAGYSAFSLLAWKAPNALGFCRKSDITLIKVFTYGKFLNPFIRGMKNG